MFADILELPESIDTETRKPASILIIDDDEALSDVLSRRLTKQGFQTIIAETGETGLTMARMHHPALIVLDLGLPDLDGFSVCMQLADATETCTIPVIILSGMERPDMLRRCRAAGCRYFLRKPYDPNVLLLLIRHTIDELRTWDDPVVQ